MYHGRVVRIAKKPSDIKSVLCAQLTSSSSSSPARFSVVPDGKMYKFIPVPFYVCTHPTECFEKTDTTVESFTSILCSIAKVDHSKLILLLAYSILHSQTTHYQGTSRHKQLTQQAVTNKSLSGYRVSSRVQAIQSSSEELTTVVGVANI